MGRSWENMGRYIINGGLVCWETKIPACAMFVRRETYEQSLKKCQKISTPNKFLGDHVCMTNQQLTDVIIYMYVCMYVYIYTYYYILMYNVYPTYH